MTEALTPTRSDPEKLSGPSSIDLEYATRIISLICRLAGSISFVDDAREILHKAGVVRAIHTHDTAALFNYLITTFSYQGVSDAAAESYIAEHGSIGWHEIKAQLAASAVCSKLESHWQFHRCGYQKITSRCAVRSLLSTCPVPRHDLRNGRLNQMAYSLFLFVRDVTNDDLIGWIDQRIALSLANSPTGYAAAGQAIVVPMRSIFGVSDKVLTMALSSILLATRRKPHWREIGGAMIVIDTLVHNFLHRTGILHRFGAEHAFGPSCYRERGCAEILEVLSSRIDARTFNPAFSKRFPRFVQHSIWRYCAQPALDVCNGNKIRDGRRCNYVYCRIFELCDRRPLRASADIARNADQ